MEISIITPSVRPEGLELVEKALKRQTFKDYEWLVNDKRYEGGYWGLNRAYNDLIRQAKGELLVSWQDYTYTDPDALEKFWAHYEAEPKTLVGAVGNKYQTENWAVKTWQDPRERNDFGSFYPTNFCDIEWNLCSVPKEAMYEIGGFDEEMDFRGFGMDGYAVNDRLANTGLYDFKLDQSIKTYSLEHDRFEGWDEHNLISKGYLKRKQELMDKGVWPYLEYIKHER